MINSIGWIEKNSLNILYQPNSIDIYHITKTQKILMKNPMIRVVIKDNLEGKEGIEENSIIQKIVIEKTIEKEEKELSDYPFILCI